ncbi:MAG: hypothetical protein ACM3KR_08945 [Deltaproteobacteria bacterium]
MDERKRSPNTVYRHHANIRKSLDYALKKQNEGILGGIEYIPIEKSSNKDYLIAKKTEKVF